MYRLTQPTAQRVRQLCRAHLDVASALRERVLRLRAMSNPVEMTTYRDISTAADVEAAWDARGVHHVGWPDNESRAAAVGWLADIVAVSNVGDGRAGVPYHDLAGTTLGFVTLGDDARDVAFSST